MDTLSKHVTPTRNHLEFIATPTVIHLIVVHGIIVAFIPFGLTILNIVIIVLCWRLLFLLMRSMYSLIFIQIIIPKFIQSQSCTCEDWICNGYTSSDNTTLELYEQCTNNSLWADITECTYCHTCSETRLICACDTESNCESNTANTNDNPSQTWWIVALLSGGTLLCLFVCAIAIFVCRGVKEDEELRLKQMMDHKHKSFDGAHESDESSHNKLEITNENTMSKLETNMNQNKRETILTINIENFDVLPMPAGTPLHDYDLIFPQTFDIIDMYTKCLVVGYVRDIHTVTAQSTDMIHFILLYVFNNTVEFDTNCKEFLMSANGFHYGYHEWSVVVTKPTVRRQEIGIASVLNPYLSIGMPRTRRTLEGIDNSICGMEDFGARTVYGTDCQTFYYASYNENNSQRCHKDLYMFHKYAHWNEGDIIKLCLDLYRGDLTFHLNDKKIKKAVKIQKNKVYYPFVSCVGRFKCQIVDYK